MKFVLQALKLVPFLVKLLSDIDEKVKAAKDPSSPGGAKVTTAEVGGIVASELGPLVEEIAKIFLPAA